MSLTKQQSEYLTRCFAYHAPTGGKAEKHAAAREACLQAAIHITNLCPEGRELSIAITKHEEAMVWANAGIARNPEKFT